MDVNYLTQPLFPFLLFVKKDRIISMRQRLYEAIQFIKEFGSPLKCFNIFILSKFVTHLHLDTIETGKL